VAYAPCNARLERERCNMTNKNNPDVAVESFKAVMDVIRDLDEECQNDPQSMLRGALHAVCSVAMLRAPSPMITMNFLLTELQHFSYASCEIIPDEAEWKEALLSLDTIKDDVTGGEDDDETMH